MESQLHQHFDTHTDPFYGLHKARNHILYWIGIAKTMVPKKVNSCGNMGSLCLDKLLLGYKSTMVISLHIPPDIPNSTTGPY